LRGRVAALAPQALVALARTRPRALLVPPAAERPLAALYGAAVFAWSGVGNPGAFEATLGDLGARVVGSLRARDHHLPSSRDVERVEEAARRAGADLVVVTRKDLGKLR